MRGKALWTATALALVTTLGCGGDATPEMTAPVILDGGMDAAPAGKDANRDLGEVVQTDAPAASLDGPATADALPDGPAPADAPTLADAAPADAPADRSPGPDTMTAPADAGGADGQPLCVASGEDCRSNPCCAGSSCANIASLGGKVCADDCAKHADCKTGCCLPLEGGGAVCAPENSCNSLPCGRYVLMGSDDVFLGEAASFPGADSVCNKFGEYGNDYGPKSIHNKFGAYGDNHSPTSAYNTFANEPPRLVCETSGVKHEWVTKNTFMFSRIDPDELCAKLMQMGK
jgi:hypothetical protein